MEKVGGLIVDYKFDLAFYKDKKVLITGHTGFKGTWLTRMLVNAGATLLHL